ncbi:RICIN domain-containing protein [Lentzea sp. NPDC051838]|uniref:RICIN domain-containing protein n=1 Tax=Lentzea sp. NPDC051838 TaxID=3154849 RepID=UPI003435D5F5
MSRSSLVSRCVRGIAALGVVTVFAGVVNSGPALAAPEPAPPTGTSAQAPAAAPPQTSEEAKINAARVIGIVATPEMLEMTDKVFVQMLWSRSPEGEIKDAALTAYFAPEELACKQFIETGIFEARDRQMLEEMKKAQRIKERKRAAAEINWIDVPQALLEGSVQNFVIGIWERAKEGSDVKKAAAAVIKTTATDEQRQTFVISGIFTASAADKQRELEEKEREERERIEREQNKLAREKAWEAVANAVATPDLIVMNDRDFIYEIIKRATALPKTKAAAQAAFDSRDAATYKTFIFTGVHTARQADRDEQDRLDAIETKRQVKEILDRALRDGYLPNLAAAAQRAYDGTTAQQNAFLLTGQHEAAKLDLIKPADKRVIELQGSASGRCLQVAGLWDTPNQGANADGAATELWDCLRGPKQVWELVKRGDKYMMFNLGSKKCMDVSGNLVVQNSCNEGSPTQYWEFLENANGTFQLRNVHTGMFASAADNGRANATLVVQYTNTNSIDQQWRIIDPSHVSWTVEMTPGIVEIKGVQSQRCLQVAGLWDVPGQGALADGAGTEIWDCVRGPKLLWELIPLGDKKYALKNRMSGKCLDLQGGSVEQVASLIQYTCHLSGNQQFAFSLGDNGTVGMFSVLTQNFVDVYLGRTENGSVTVVHPGNGGSNQRWTVNLVG